MDASSWLHVDTDLDFVQPALREMLLIWQRQRGQRSMPRRADMSPEVLRGHLGWVVLIDVEPTPLRFRYRLIGSRITEAVGRDSTGAYLDELYAPAIYDVAISAFRVLLDHKCPVRAYGTLTHAEKGFTQFEAIDMPLSEDGEAVSMIMTRSHLAGWSEAG